MTDVAVRPTLVTAKNAAAYLKVSRDTLRRWTEHGHIPHRQDPDTRRVRYSIPRLDRWLSDGCPSEAS